MGHLQGQLGLETILEIILETIYKSMLGVYDWVDGWVSEGVYMCENFCVLCASICVCVWRAGGCVDGEGRLGECVIGCVCGWVGGCVG